MTVIESMMIGVFVVLASLHAILLAAAALWFVSDMSARLRQRKVLPRQAVSGYTRLDLQA